MISVHETEKLSLKEIEKFLLAAKQVRFQASRREEIYGWIERLLCQQEYLRQGRPARGLLRRYIGKMTGLSRAQLTRLVGRYLATGQVRSKGTGRHHFPPTPHSNPNSFQPRLLHSSQNFPRKEIVFRLFRSPQAHPWIGKHCWNARPAAFAKA
jgi:hypothetical protein